MLKLALRLTIATILTVASSFAVAEVYATFTTGAIAEYSSNNANRNDNSTAFADAPRAIEYVAISQPGEAWGGTQGNDYDVTLNIHYFDGNVLSVPATFNWVKNRSGGGIDYFGLIFQSQPNDGYVLTSSSLKRTYILPLPDYAANFITLISTDATDGSANFGDNEFTDLRAVLTSNFGNSAELSLTKTGVVNDGGDGIAHVGDTISYTFTVTNTGDLTVTNISISDPLLTGSGNTLTGGPLSSLAVGASDSITFSGTYTLTQADIDAGGVRNSATVSGSSSAGAVTDTSGSVSYLDTATDVVFNQTASIKLIKTATLNSGSDGYADAGDTITYNFTVVNDGDQTVTGITVADPMISISGGPITLAAGASDTSTFSGIYTLTQNDIDAGVITNTAFARGIDPNNWSVEDTSGTSAQNDTPTTLILTENPQLSLVKAGIVNASQPNGSAVVGDTIDYTFTVKNTGNVTLTNISISDPMISIAGGPITLSPGATNSYAFSGSYTITSSDITQQSVSNQATASGVSPNNTSVTDLSGTAFTNNTTTITALQVDPQIEGWKLSELVDNDNSGDLTKDDQIVYTIYAKNTGNVTLTSVGVQSDTILAADGSAAGASLGAITLVPGSLTTLNPGQVASFRTTYTVAQSDIDAGGLSNSATVKGVFNGTTYTDITDDNVDTDGTLTNANDPTKNLISPSPSIVVVKTATLNDGNDGVADAGDTIAYSFVVTNTGNTTLTNITISDPGVTVTGGAISLSPQQSNATNFTATYTLTQSDIDAGQVINSATVSGRSPGSVTNNVSDLSGTLATNDAPTITALAASPAIESWKLVAITNDADSSQTLTAADTLTYTVTIKNTGNVTLTNAVIQSDTLTQLDSTPATNSLSTFSLVSGSTTLAPGATVSYSATYLVDTTDILAGGLSNTAIANADFNSTTYSDVTHNAADTDGRTTNYSSPTTIAAADIAQITVTKTASTISIVSPTLGQQITYTITAQNTGNVALTNVTLSDMLTNGGTLSVQPGVTTDGELDPGETWSWSASYLIDQDDIDAGKVENVASVTGTKPDNNTLTVYSGVNATPSTATSSPNAGGKVLTTITQTASISLLKTSNVVDSNADFMITAGDTVNYIFEVTNTGATSLTNVSLSDIAASFTGTGAAPIPTYASGDDGNGILDLSETWTYNASYTILSNDINGTGYIENQALVTAAIGTTNNSISAQSQPSDSASAGATTTFLGAICGTVFEGTRRLNSVTIKLFDSSSRLVDTATSNANGQYCFTNLSADTYQVSFQPVNAKPFRGYDGHSTSQNINGGLNKVTSITIAYGQGTTRNYDDVNAITIDPSGVIYDSSTRAPISGATVTLLFNGSPANNSWIVSGSNTQTTGSDGAYSFLLQSPAQTGTYSLSVAAAGYTFPSSVIPVTASSYTPGLGGGIDEIVASSLAPTGSDPTDHYLAFNFSFSDWTDATTLSDGIVHNHLPLDPELASVIITKTADTTNISSPITNVTSANWTITANNTGTVTLSSVSLTDTLRDGAGNNVTLTSTRNGANSTDASFDPGDVWSWTVTYVLQSTDISAGQIDNYAKLSGQTPSGTAIEVYSAADRTGSTSTVAPSIGNGSIVTIQNNVNLIPLIETDLEKVINDDIAATMTQQSAGISAMANRASERLKDINPNECQNTINELINRSPIMFDTGSSVILPSSYGTLDEIADILRSCQNIYFEVSGHTDDRASEAYNMSLSLARASAVVSALKERHVSDDSLMAIGFGETKPIATNSTDDGRRRNRRVEFNVINSNQRTDYCRNQIDDNYNFGLHTNEQNATYDGNFIREVFNCSRNEWRTLSGQASYLKNDSGISQGMFSFDYKVEQLKSDESILGWFLGAYGTQDDISGLSVGTINGYGLYGGVFGANQSHAGLFFDYYAGASTGRHDFNVDFARSGGDISAQGFYTYYALFAGGAVSGEVHVQAVELQPRIGVDLAWSPGGKAEVLATRSTTTEFGALSTTDTSGVRLFGEASFLDFIPDRPTILSLAPRIFCEQPIGSSTGVCGLGSRLEFSYLGEKDEVSYSLILDGEVTQFHERYGVTFNLERPLLKGIIDTSISVSQRGTPESSLTYTLEY